jgi:long-subunit acyl-CoA synthetase (AMP-forming)
MRFHSFEEMLTHHVRLTPEAAAFLTEGGETPRTVTFAAFESDVDKRAAELRGCGKTCLGIFCDGTYENIVEVFASVKAGLQTVLLNDNAAPEQVTAADADFLWGDEDLKEEFAPALTEGFPKPTGNVLFFTSGTTSTTKAVTLTEESLCASAYNGSALLPLSPDDILMCMLPLDHVFGFVCGVLWGLSCGACVALGRGPRHYFDDLTYYRPTALSAVPMLIGFLLQKRLLNPELKLVLIGAGECPPAIPAALRQMGVRVSCGYGLTETSSGVALSLGDDTDLMTVCPDDRISIAEDGEILIENHTCMMRGYYKNEVDTAAVLQNGVLRTGDLGSLDDEGRLRILGRKKEMLVLSDGTKVFLPEYEQRIRAALGDRDFAVMGEEGSVVLVLQGDDTEKDAVNALLKEALRTVPMGQRPKRIVFVPNPLPRTATGKIKRWELQQKVGKL